MFFLRELGLISFPVAGIAIRMLKTSLAIFCYFVALFSRWLQPHSLKNTHEAKT
jgi:hypothetical protein